MSSLASIMDAALSGLYSARVAMQTVGHNIANANTPGFSRQEVLLGTRAPASLVNGLLGRGVQVQGIRRMTDEFLIQNHREQSSRLGNYEQFDSALQEIEAIFGSVENDHLGDSLTRFFNSWDELASPPSDVSHKQVVLGAAQSLVSDFQATDGSLADLERSMASSIEVEVGRLNQQMEQVAVLNRQLLSSEIGGNNANDLRDQRDRVITEISKLAEVSVIERDDGTVDVIMAGRTLVSRAHTEPLQVYWEHDGNEHQMVLVTAASKHAVALADGKLSGMVDSRNEVLGGARAHLDDLARLLADKVNELHVQGRVGSSSGIPFFVGDTAASLQVNPVLLQDPDMVVTGRSGAAGDNDIALEIAALAKNPLDSEGGSTLLDRFRTMVVDLASQRSRYDFLTESQENVVAAVESRLESVRGVSLDEEGANLVRFQHTYEASARVITAVQEMFQTLLEL